MLENLNYLEALPTKELKQIQARITKTLKIREEERERVMRHYQEELDRLLDAIEADGFYVGIPDWPSGRVAVLVPEDEESEP